MGNARNNRVDGKEGQDIYVVNGLKGEFNLVETAEGWTLEDTVNDRNGLDTLINIEQIAFSDAVHPLR
jgi:hypothetical protein